MFTIEQIKNAYGIGNFSPNDDHKYSQNLENLKNFSINSHNEIYVVHGLNRSGKSSMTRILQNALNEEPIKNHFKWDRDEAKVKLRIQGESVTYDKGQWSNTIKLREAVLVYNKSFINRSVSEFGRSIKLKSTARTTDEIQNDINKFVADHASEIKAFRNQLLPYTKKSDFPANDIAKSLGVLYSQKNVDMLNKVNELVNKQFHSKQSLSYESLGLIKENIACAFFKASKNSRDFEFDFVEKIIKDEKKIISDALSKYNISGIDEAEFYDHVVNYLKTKKPENCPVCLQDENFNVDEVINEIEASLNTYRAQYSYNKMETLINNIKEFLKEHDYPSLLSEYLEVLESVTRRLPVFQLNKFSKVKKQIETVIVNTETYVMNKFASEFEDELKKYNDYLCEHEKTLAENKKINSPEIVESIERHMDNFGLLEKRLFQFHYDEQTHEINLSCNDAKNGVNFHEVFEQGISESEKSLISLAYYFALVDYRIKKYGNDVLCWIDDPIDSHDHHNKFLVTYALMSYFSNGANANQKYMVILTHSLDLIRNMHLQHKNQLIHRWLKRESKNGYIDIKKQDIELLLGTSTLMDYTLENNLKMDWMDLLGVLPVLRDYLIYAQNLKIGKLYDIESNSKKINEAHNQISEKYLHYNPNQNLRISDLRNIFTEYVHKVKTHNGYQVSQLEFRENLKEKAGDFLTESLKKYVQSIKYQTAEVKEVRIYKEIIRKANISLYIRRNMEAMIYELTPNYSYGVKCLQKKILNQTNLATKARLLKDKLENESNSLENYSKKLYLLIMKYKNLINAFQHPMNTGILTLIETPLMTFRKILDEMHSLNKEMAYSLTNYKSIL